jgi:hypothetical protein
MPRPRIGAPVWASKWRALVATILIASGCTQNDADICNDVEPPNQGVDVGGGRHVTRPADWDAQCRAGTRVPGCTASYVEAGSKLYVSDVVQAGMRDAGIRSGLDATKLDGFVGKLQPVIASQYTGTTLTAILLLGHSNCGGTNIDPDGSNSPPELIPSPFIDLFRRALVSPEIMTDTTLKPLKVTTYGGAAGVVHGSELAMGLGLYELTGRVAILKVSANGSKYSHWVEGGTYNSALQTAIANFKTVVASAYPTVTTINWFRVTLLGTNEGGAASGSAAQCNAMPGLATTFRTQVLSYIGISSFVKELVVRESVNIQTQPFFAEEVAAQTTIAAQGTNGVLVNTDDIITLATEQSDGRHFTGAGQNALGTRDAEIIAAAL